MLKSMRVRAKRSGGGNYPVAQAFASNNDNFCRKPLYFKPAALAKAIAGVFVCGALSGEVLAAPDITVGDIGGYSVVVNPNMNVGMAFTNTPYFDGKKTEENWSFESSSLDYSSWPISEINISGMHWNTWVNGSTGNETLKHNTNITLNLTPVGSLVGHTLFDVVSTNGGTAKIMNEGSGTINIKGGLFHAGIDKGAIQGGSFSIVNSGNGHINIYGGERPISKIPEVTTEAYDGITIFAEGISSEGWIINSGDGFINCFDGYNSKAIDVFLSNGATGGIKSSGKGVASLGMKYFALAAKGEISVYDGSVQLNVVRLAESKSSVSIANKKNLEIKGDWYYEGDYGDYANVVTISGGDSVVEIINEGHLETDIRFAGSAYENHNEGSGSLKVSNNGGTVTVRVEEYDSLVNTGGSSIIDNNSGSLYLNPSQGSFFVGRSGYEKNEEGEYISEGTFIINNMNGGVVYFSDTNGGFASFVEGDSSTSTIKINNSGTLSLSKGWMGNFNVQQNAITNKKNGIVEAEAGALFIGEYNLPSVNGEAKPLPISILDKFGHVASVTTSGFSSASATQTGNVTLKDDWKNYSQWEDGGIINFTDVAAGTALAESIKSQFESAFGTGTTINFTGTGSGSGSGSSTFDMNVVNALITENKLASGSVITSEALTHTGKSFTLSNTGDMTQDTGFMGILGSTGITVKDGKTLTLMGSQASMAMAVGADTRDANYVITDAPMTLTNGTLNLGHKALSATEGTLAAVTFDRESSVNVDNGIYSIDSLKGEGSLSLSTGTRTTVVGDLSATQVTNAGTLTVNGQTVLGASPEAQSMYAAPKRQTLSNEKGATANFNGGLVVNDFVQVKNREGGTLNAGHVKVDTFGRIMNYTGATMTYASIDADGIVGNQGTLNVSGAYVVGDEGETTFGGETQVGTLSVGRTAKTLLMARDGQEAIVHNTGKTYAEELDLVSGHIQVEKDGVLAGKTLKNGAVGSDIVVDVGGTFGFSHDKSSLDNALKNYTGSKDDKAILALNTDLHFANGGSLTVGSVDDAKGTVNLGNDALLLLGTTQLHGEALLNGESSQHLHVEDGAVIAMTDDLLWGNHYLMKGFDEASTAEILKIGILDKDGKKLDTRENDKGIYVTVGSDKILDKDKSYRFVNQMNWLLDGHQDLTAEEGDVAFLTAALVDKQGALATNRMEALAMDAGVLAETQRMGAQVQTTMLDHASSSRKGYGTFWADGIFSKTDSGAFKRSTGTSSYEADTTGFAFGMDLPLGDDSWRLGAAFSAQRGDLDGDFGLTSDIEGYGFSVYGGKTFTSGLNLTGAMTYMTASHEVDAFNLGKVKADVDANMWVLGARVSMPFAYHQVWMTPYIGADVMKVKQDGFTSSWSDKSAFHYADVDATLFRTPVGVKAGTFMPLELLGRSGTLNWDADLAFVPQFGDKNVDYRVSGVSNGHADGMTGSFVNDWLTTANFGMSWQGAAGAFGLYYGIEKGDVRDLSHAIRAKASLFF